MRDWHSYDSIAERYDDVWAGRFEAAARHVWALAPPRPGDAILDIGTGTGVVPRALGERAGDARLLVGCDRSAAMLSRARKRVPGLRVVVADAARLPFPMATFDIATASFVLSHVRDHALALADAFRVLRPSGVLAVSSWAPSTDPYGAAWTEMLSQVLSKDAVQQATAEVAPWEEHFSDAERLKAAMVDARFVEVRVRTVDLEFAFSVAQYLRDRELSSGGRLGRASLGEERWARFLAEARDALVSQFGSHFSYTRGVLVALGRKP